MTQFAYQQSCRAETLHVGILCPDRLHPDKILTQEPTSLNHVFITMPPHDFAKAYGKTYQAQGPNTITSCVMKVQQGKDS